jgi:RNA polymerase sigma-70 factor, ECF subfamily
MNEDIRLAWLERAREGDKEALGKLLEDYRPYLSVIVRARKNSRLLARVGDSDQVQDIFLEVCRQFSSFRGTRLEELVSWFKEMVLGVMANAARSHLGTAKRDLDRERPLNEVGGLSGVGSTPSAVAIRHEESALLAKAMVRLPDDMQRVLLGRHVHQLSYAHLAFEMERSEAAVRVLHVRALRRLRAECS